MRPWLITVIAVVSGVVLACRPPAPPERRPREPDPTLPPTFDPAQVMSIPLEKIREYAQRLSFDTVLGAADEELVDFERALIGTGSRARIEPEMGLYRISDKEVAEGRIIARIRSDKAVPSRGYGPWWTWWWVDKRGPGETFRSVFIAESEKPGTRVIGKGPLTIEYHPGYYWRQAIARFRVYSDPAPGGDPYVMAWGNCGGCCRQ
jgi:hypothetical protein